MATKKRPFTDAEREAIRERYPSVGAIPLAVEFGRKRADIVSCAQRLGVLCESVRAWPSEADSRLIELHAEGLTVPQIAPQLGRTQCSVYKRIETLGLAKRRGSGSEVRPDNAKSRSIQTHWARVRIGMGEHGWPPDVTVKQVAILNALHVHGPQSRRILSGLIGEAADRPLKRLLNSHHNQSAVSPLMRCGLVARLTLGNGRKRVSIYTLTAYAMSNHGQFTPVATYYEEAAARGRKES